MNNRGAQLQKHEIIKAKMMAKIVDRSQREVFAKIWDACSQMDEPIQRLFSAEDRKNYFGEMYDGFAFPIIANHEGQQTDKATQWSLEDILLDLADQTIPAQHDENDTMETEVYSYNSIIDFPNFLMHVLKLYLDTAEQNGDSVPLNEKELLNEYGKYQDIILPVEFMKLLLFCRTIFDRFVIKTATDAEDSEDGRKWVLLKPKNYGKNWKYISSFDEGISQKKLIKALSMLQVTFRTRIYKTWLYDVLKWLYDKKYQQGCVLSVDANQYLEFLHQWMSDYYDGQNFGITTKIPVGEMPSLENSYSQGTGL